MGTYLVQVDSSGDVEDGRKMVAGVQCGDDRRYGNLSRTMDSSGAWEEATGRIA
jgi:hypothetical protein